MCDTFVATPDFTSNGKMLFGKNSDREPNEAQSIVRYPASRPKEKRLKVTHIEIPQSNETFEIILSKPFQMWGAEMGANEHGLTIGNEAIFSKIKFAKLNKGLTGMDMLRLALERTKSAETALELITSLVEEYGQDACAGYEDKNFYYFSSYIIADAKDAWLLETAGEQWAAKKLKVLDQFLMV
jgi:dipeptidase